MDYSATLLKRVEPKEREQVITDMLYLGCNFSVKFEEFVVSDEVPVLSFCATDLKEGDHVANISSFIWEFKSFTGSVINLIGVSDSDNRIVYFYEDSNGKHYMEVAVKLVPVTREEQSEIVLVADSSILSQTLANDYFDLLDVTKANGVIISSVFSQYKITLIPKEAYEVKENYQLFKYKRYNEFSSWLDSVISHNVKNNNMHCYIKMHSHDGEDSIYFELILEPSGSLTRTAADFIQREVEDKTQPVLEYSKLLQGPNTNYLAIFKHFEKEVKATYECASLVRDSSVQSFC